MFGLMRAKKCGMSADQKHFRRLNYCGTCKTIGSVYSAKARILLNNDTVFLAEILSSLSGEDVNEWQRSYQSLNCLSLPKGSFPRSLEWAAAANVILTEFKVADHVADGEGIHFKFAGRIFSRDFEKAERFLWEHDFPLAEVASILGSQVSREGESVSLDDLAYPTAQATGIFFREGVRHVGREELGEDAFELGFAFGKLVYLLDAFEDYEKDVRRESFNAFQAIFELKEKVLTTQARRRINAILAELEVQIASKIGALPISESQRELFASRLSDNLRRKVRTELPIVRIGSVCVAKPRSSVRERWHAALEKARELARNYSWQTPLVFGFVLVFALVAPAAHLREARSPRECFDLGFNLIFLGAVFGSVLALPKKLLMEGPDLKEEAVKHAVKGGKGGGSSWCGGCDCDGCDCCCDCGSCCECGDCC